MPFPPLSMEQSKEIALSKLGQQAYYDRASKGIRGQYEVERFQNILSMLEPDIFTRTTVDGLARLVLQRHRHHRERRTRRALRNKKALEDEVNRILIVLRASLNDDPAARDPHPWKYFNPKYYPSIPPVANPVHFRPSNQQHPPEDTRQGAMGSNVTTYIKLPPVGFFWIKTVAFDDCLRTLLKIVWEKLNDWRRRVWYHLRVWFPALQPGSTRQRVLESVYDQIRLDVPTWFALK